MARALSIGSVFAALFLGVLALEPGAAFGQDSTSRVFVEVTEDGYEPKNLNILQGTKVVWTNTGAKEHWPASNNHPSHTRYPGSGIVKCGTEEETAIFDACRGLTPGESWSFVFEKAGEWRYHDHLYPSLGGTVFVFKTESERVRAASGVEKISFSERLIQFFSGWFRSIGKFLRLLPAPEMPSVEEFRLMSESEREQALEMLAEYDAARAWKYLKEAAYKDEAQVIDAHKLAHLAGNALYREYGFSGIRECDPTFAFGCLHGAAEKFLQAEGPQRVTKAATICKNMFPEEERSPQYASCVHGLGHGLLTWHGLDLNAALRSCGLVPNDARIHCYDGVFMEFSFSASRAQYPLDDPWSLCTKLPEEFYVPCARYQPILMNSILGMSPEEQARLCREAPDPILKHNCIGRIGFDAAWGNRENPAGAIQFCESLFSAPLRSACITSAAIEYVFQEFPGWRESSATLCDSLFGDEQKDCFSERQKNIEAYERRL